MTFMDPTLGDFLLWAQERSDDSPMSKAAYQMLETLAGDFVSESIVASQERGVIGAVREVRMASANSEGFPPFAIISGGSEHDEMEESIARHPSSGPARGRHLSVVKSGEQ